MKRLTGILNAKRYLKRRKMMRYGMVEHQNKQRGKNEGRSWTKQRAKANTFF